MSADVCTPRATLGKGRLLMAPGGYQRGAPLAHASRSLPKRAIPNRRVFVTHERKIDMNTTHTLRAKSLEALRRIHLTLDAQPELEVSKLATITPTRVADVINYPGSADNTVPNMVLYRVPVPGGWLVSPTLPHPAPIFISDPGVAANYGAATVTVAAAGGTYTRSSGSYLNDGFIVGQTVTFGGFANAGNNGAKVLTAVSALVLTVANAGMVNEATVASTTANTPARSGWDPTVL